jgi:hypothetical protein
MQQGRKKGGWVGCVGCVGDTHSLARSAASAAASGHLPFLPSAQSCSSLSSYQGTASNCADRGCHYCGSIINCMYSTALQKVLSSKFKCTRQPLKTSFDVPAGNPEKEKRCLFWEVAAAAAAAAAAVVEENR